MKILEYLFKTVGIVAAVGLFLLGISVMIYSFAEIFHVVELILELSTSEGKVVSKALSVVDLILLGFSIFITSIGIYELFVGHIAGLPQWLQFEDFDAVKSILIKVAIVVMGISFMGRVVTWDGSENIFSLGISVGAVIIALSYFLGVKNLKKTSHK